MKQDNSIRESNEYKAMTPLDAIEIVEDKEGSAQQTLAAWQYLHDTGMAYKLQGFYGRAAQHLIKENVIAK